MNGRTLLLQRNALTLMENSNFSLCLNSIYGTYLRWPCQEIADLNRICHRIEAAEQEMKRRKSSERRIGIYDFSNVKISSNSSGKLLSFHFFVQMRVYFFCTGQVLCELTPIALLVSTRRVDCFTNAINNKP